MPLVPCGPLEHRKRATKRQPTTFALGTLHQNGLTSEHAKGAPTYFQLPPPPDTHEFPIHVNCAKNITLLPRLRSDRAQNDWLRVPERHHVTTAGARLQEFDSASVPETHVSRTTHRKFLLKMMLVIVLTEASTDGIHVRYSPHRKQPPGLLDESLCIT